MADFRARKVVATLPGTLDADTIYFVRTGTGFDTYLTDNTGATAHKQNGGALPDTTDLADPGGMRLVYWNDATNQLEWLGLGTGLSVVAGALVAAGGGGNITVSTTAPSSPAVNDIWIDKT